jgi:hypothetical protein
VKALNIAMTSVLTLLLSVSAKAELVSTAGGLGVYDSVHNVTWTSDGNLFATQAASYSGGSSAFVAAVIAASGGVINDTPNTFDTPSYSGSHTLSVSDFNAWQYGYDPPNNVNPFGAMNWWGAKAWVNYLNETNYAGSNTWALPTTVDIASSYVSPPPSDSSQLVELFYGGLGHLAGAPIADSHNSSYALFTNIQDYAYWSVTETSAELEGAWSFFNSIGYLSNYGKTRPAFALAVAPGDISAAPIPGAVWLLGSGLLGLAGLRRKGQKS